MKSTSLESRALRMAALRIGLVAALAGVASYVVNHSQIEDSVRDQLALSTSERVQREGAPFTEVADIERNFLREFMESYNDSKRRAAALAAFDDLFVLDPDGAWRERPGMYDGKESPDGRQFAKIGALKAPNSEPLTDDCKARMVLGVEWVHRYGNALRGRQLNFSATLPEHVLIMFAPDVPFNSREIFFTGKDAFRLEDYESFTLSFHRDHDGFGVTPMYFDPTISTWMVTAYAWLAHPPTGAKLASVSLDISLEKLRERSAIPGISGCTTIILRGDPEGKIIYHPALLEEIKQSKGNASVQSLGSPELKAIQAAAKRTEPGGHAEIIETGESYIAVGRIPDADWILAVRYPKALMQPAVLQNLTVVALVGLAALVVELFILRSILRNQVGKPLAQLTEATRALGANGDQVDPSKLPTASENEVGELARDFAVMAKRVEDAQVTLEAKVELRTKEAKAAQAEAESANRAKSAFLAHMSHEIRTPMNAILGFSQIMSRDPSLPRDQAQRVDTINRAGEHLLALINDILEMSKIEAGHIVRHDTAFDLHAVLDDLVVIYSERARTKGLTLVLEKSPFLPRYITSDEGKIRQTLVNLLGNAVKFTSEGGVSIIAKSTGDSNENRELSFTVADTGPGLTEEEIKILFRPFVQASAGAKMGGTGLGLAIVRQYARLLDGDIRVEAAPGKGAAFTFTMNAMVATESDVAKKHSERIIRRLAPGQSARVLIADDVAMNRDLLEAILNPMGFETKSVANGMEALEAAHTWKPHAILMDMRMPGMDGFEAIRLIRSTDHGKMLLIIGLTASAFEKDRAAVLSAGADFFVRKPFKSDELLAILGERLHLQYEYLEQAKARPGSRDEIIAFGSIPESIRGELQSACREADYDRLLILCDSLATTEHRAAAASIRERILAYDYEGALRCLAAPAET